jgi:hypothetical protein
MSLFDGCGCRYSAICFGFQTKLAIWQAIGAEEQLAKLIAYSQGQLGRPVILDANYGDVPAMSANMPKPLSTVSMLAR